MVGTNQIAIRVFVALASMQAFVGRAEDNGAGLGCIQEMLLPAYGSIARKATRPGSVTVQANIGSKGSIASLIIKSPDRFLSREVEVFLRYNTTYRVDCEGKTVMLVFTFVLEGDPVVDPTVRVKFRGPNQFVIESQPQAPIVDRTPLKRQN